MKKFFYPGIILSLLLLTILSGCSGGGGSSPSGPTTSTSSTPGISSSYTVGAVSFKMSYAPSCTYPSDDNSLNGTKNPPVNIQVSNSFRIAQTDVTYQLWSAVYSWATSHGYSFSNSGGEGGNDAGVNISGGDQQPVVFVSWRDAMVWRNALTEYYNATNGTNLTCVYTYNGAIVRDSTSKNATACDNVTATISAKGFRLPTSNEWELAARYQDGKNWTPGDHVSGDVTGYCYKSGISATASTIFGNYAWYCTTYGGNCNSTKPVAQKFPNSLGLYDMCGNASQWCFDWNSGQTQRTERGGCWYNEPMIIQLGVVINDSPSDARMGIGFRVVMTV